MKSTLKILIVEDESKKISEWHDAIEHHNADVENKGYLLEMVEAESVAVAKKELALHRFDAAIIDLRLKTDHAATENNSEGNLLVKYILENMPIGIAIFTGQPGDASIEPYAKDQVLVIDKGEGFEPVFEWLDSQKNVFLTLRKTQNIIDCEVAKIFFQSIWPRWRLWAIEDEPEEPRLTEYLTRHIVAHIHDSLLDVSSGKVHSEESYFVPPLKERLDTGDLISEENSVWIVVTPRCDLANDIANQSSSILLANCEDISVRWNESNQKTKDKISQHDGALKKHFISFMTDHKGAQRGPWFVNFNKLKTTDSGQVTQLLSTRFASLSPIFVPSLVERFGAYFSRIGTPNLSKN